MGIITDLDEDAIDQLGRPACRPWISYKGVRALMSGLIVLTTIGVFCVNAEAGLFTALLMVVGLVAINPEAAKKT